VIDRKAMLISLGLIVLMTVTSLIAWALLPGDGPIATHFGVDGQPNGWMPPAEAFLFGPALSVVLWGFFAFVRRQDPSRHVRGEAVIIYAPVTVVALAQFYVISYAFHVDWSAPRLVGAAIGVSWIMTGNLLGKLAPNHAFGLRTPWTLADPQVWDQTNRFGGWVMVLAGLAEIVITLALPPSPQMLLAIVALPIASVAAILVKSWLLWRLRHPGESAMTRPGAWWPLAISIVTVTAILLDIALEQGRSGGVIAAGCLVALAVTRRYQSRHQRR